jgi:hypothetical protein
MNKLELVKKVFKKEQAIDFLKIHRPHLFGLKTPRSKKIQYLGDDLWGDISKIENNHIKDFAREYSIKNEMGKYFDINLDPEYHKSLINKSKIDKKDSPCHPEQFSESVVKPIIRKYIKEKCNDDLETYITNTMTTPLIKHALERFNQQSKADWSEYLLLIHCPNVFPTLKHTKGTDMYLLNSDDTIDDLDIKTTRNIWGIEDKKEAIKMLYEKQGKDRFSDDPRLYIYLSDKELCESDNIINQMNEKYDIDFKYEHKDYKVIGCRLIII